MTAKEFIDYAVMQLAGMYYEDLTKFEQNLFRRLRDMGRMRLNDKKETEAVKVTGTKAA